MTRLPHGNCPAQYGAVSQPNPPRGPLFTRSLLRRTDFFFSYLLSPLPFDGRRERGSPIATQLMCIRSASVCVGAGAEWCAYNFSFMCYFVQQWPAIVQAASAAIVAYLTYRLVLATDTYARIRRETLALNKSRFEQELL